MAEGFQINRCSLEDLSILSQMSKQTFADAFQDQNGPFNFKGYINEAFSETQLSYELKNRNSEFYFGFQNNSRIGYFKINHGLAQTDLMGQGGLELERIYVLADHQNMGYGASLLYHAIQIARERSIPFIWLGVWEQNTKAIKFYQQHGFEHDGYHPFKLGDEDQTDWIMKLWL